MNVAPEKCAHCGADAFDVIGQGAGFRCLSCGTSVATSEHAPEAREALAAIGARAFERLSASSPAAALVADAVLGSVAGALFRPARLEVRNFDPTPGPHAFRSFIPGEAAPLPDRGQPLHLPLLLPTGIAVGMPWPCRVIGFTAYDRPEGQPGRQRTIDPREWLIESFQIGWHDQFLGGALPLAAICDPIDRMQWRTTIPPGVEIRVRARRIDGPHLPPPREGTELESTRELAALGGYVPEGRCLWLVVA